MSYKKSGMAMDFISGFIDADKKILKKILKFVVKI